MKKTRFNQITPEELKLAVEKSNFLSEVLLYFGYGKNSGSMYGYFRKKIKELNIDDNHLGVGKGNVPHKTSKDNYYVYSLDEILIENSKYNNNTRLKKRIIKAGLLEYKCAMCENPGVWMNKKMTLQLDHINGDNTDNRLENLRILCPNCHSQTPTYGNKNRGEDIQTKKDKKKRKRIIKKKKLLKKYVKPVIMFI